VVEEGVLGLNPQKEVCLPVSPQSDCLWQGWKRRRGAILKESYAQGLDFGLQVVMVHSLPPEPPAEEEEEDDTEAEPVHVSMTEEQIKQLTIPLIKEELRLRRVPFKASLKKDGLLEKLREALMHNNLQSTLNNNLMLLVLVQRRRKRMT
jgi:hypothetical protein